MDNPNQLLAELVKAIDGALISSWQSTSAWDKELAAAREYVEKLKGGVKFHEDCFENSQEGNGEFTPYLNDRPETRGTPC